MIINTYTQNNTDKYKCTINFHFVHAPHRTALHFSWVHSTWNSKKKSAQERTSTNPRYLLRSAMHVELITIAIAELRKECQPFFPFCWPFAFWPASENAKGCWDRGFDASDFRRDVSTWILNFTHYKNDVSYKTPRNMKLFMQQVTTCSVLLLVTGLNDQKIWFQLRWNCSTICNKIKCRIQRRWQSVAICATYFLVYWLGKSRSSS